MLAHEDLGQFEEAHHWNIQAKFYNEKFPLVYESYNIGDSLSRRSWCYFEAQVWKKDSNIVPSLFSLIFSFFLFLAGFFGLFILFGLLSAFWERGYPDLRACGLRRGSRSGPVWPTFINTCSRPSRGAKPRGEGRQEASPGMASSGRLARRRRDQGGVPHEVPMTQAMMTKARRAPGRAVSLFPLWCKGGKRRCGVPRHQAKVSILVQWDQGQQDGKMEVTMEPKTVSTPEPLAGEDRL